MNKQLLEDIGQSQFPPSTSPAGKVGATKASGEQVPEAPPPPAPDMDFRVWRHGKTAAAGEALHAASELPDPPPVQARPPEPETEKAAPAAPEFLFQPASVDETPSWFERWGRRAVISAIGFAGLLMLFFGAFSVYQDRTDDKTLSLLATNAPPKRAAPVAKVPPATLAAVPAPPPEASAAQPVPAAPARGAPRASVPDLVMLEPPAAAPTAPPAAPPPPKKIHPRAKAVAVARAPEETAPVSPISATLRECRALGYHTEQCLKRACVLTKYGLACKG
jgi:hypothetical protein